MSSESRIKPCLFSAISGTITLDGKPVANAKVKRLAGKAHSEGQKIDETFTDDNGKFEMPAVFDRVLLAKVLPMEFAVSQQIFVYIENKEYEIWNGVKRQRQENSESSGNPLIVSCELNQAHKMVSVGGGFVSSNCLWDFTPDPPLILDDPLPDDEL